MNSLVIQRDFDPEIAKELGVNAAIILENIIFWIGKNVANEKHFYDNTYWTYNTMEAFEKLFPYLTFDQIRRNLEKLTTSKYLIKGNFNKHKYDRTLWYTISEAIWQKRQMDLARTPNANGKNATPIPNDNTDGKPIYQEPIVEDSSRDESPPLDDQVNSRNYAAEKFKIQAARKAGKGKSIPYRQSSSNEKKPSNSKRDFTPLSDVELWEIAKELNVPPYEPKQKQKEVLDMIEDGSLPEKYGNTMKFVIKKFIAFGKQKGIIETLDEMGRMALEADHPTRIAEREEAMRKMKEEGII